MITTDTYEVEPGITIVPGLPALLVNRNTLVIADLHLGIESELASTGLYLPRIQFYEVLKKLARILEGYAHVEHVVIAGDLKHRFDKLTWQEKREIESLILELRKRDVDITVVRGNHDTFIRPLLDKLGVEFEECCRELGPSIVVTHGHIDIGKIYLQNYDYIIMGHEHPVYQAKISGASVGRFQSFLKIPTTEKATIIVLPAFGVYQSGNPISPNREDYLSPIIRGYGRVEDAVPIVVEEDVVVELPQLSMLLA